jgi:hypothetical protein
VCGEIGKLVSPNEPGVIHPRGARSLGALGEGINCSDIAWNQVRVGTVGKQEILSPEVLARTWRDW